MKNNQRSDEDLNIQISGYSHFSSSNFKKSTSLDEKFLYYGLGKYKNILAQKEEFNKLKTDSGNTNGFNAKA